MLDGSLPKHENDAAFIEWLGQHKAATTFDKFCMYIKRKRPDRKEGVFEAAAYLFGFNPVDEVRQRQIVSLCRKVYGPNSYHGQYRPDLKKHVNAPTGLKKSVNNLVRAPQKIIDPDKPISTTDLPWPNSDIYDGTKPPPAEHIPFCHLDTLTDFEAYLRKQNMSAAYNLRESNLRTGKHPTSETRNRAAYEFGYRPQSVAKMRTLLRIVFDSKYDDSVLQQHLAQLPKHQDDEDSGALPPTLSPSPEQQVFTDARAAENPLQAHDRIRSEIRELVKQLSDDMDYDKAITWAMNHRSSHDEFDAATEAPSKLAFEMHDMAINDKKTFMARYIEHRKSKDVDSGDLPDIQDSPESLEKIRDMIRTIRDYREETAPSA